MTDFRPGRFQVLPLVVKNLLIINVIMVFAQFVLGKMGIDLSVSLGLHYWKSPLFRPWQFITHIFMHGSYNDLDATILHLFSNMFALWMFGSILENVWGPKRFLTFYMICGVGAALCHLGVLHYEFSLFNNALSDYQQNTTVGEYGVFLQKHKLDHIEVFNNLRLAWENNPVSVDYGNTSLRLLHQYRMLMYDEATVGASGAVFGILFAFGYLFPNTLLYIYFLIPIKAKYVVGAYALFEIFAGFRNSAGDQIAHFAHLGGMLFAFILLRFWKDKYRDRLY